MTTRHILRNVLFFCVFFLFLNIEWIYQNSRPPAPWGHYNFLHRINTFAEKKYTFKADIAKTTTAVNNFR